MAREIRDEPVPASLGAGPLIQRDYWAVIRNPRGRPYDLIAWLVARFPEVAPPDLVRFRRVDGPSAPLKVGDDVEVRIRMAGTCRVRVVHATATSFTFATLPGHPEAGRITFGCYRNPRGDLILHIRSRARSSTRVLRYGFLVGGDPVQTGTWTDFIDRFAHLVGEGVVGAIHVESRVASEETEDRRGADTPTYTAIAD